MEDDMSEGGPDHLSVQEWKKFEQRTMTDGYRENFANEQLFIFIYFFIITRRL